MGPRRYVGRRGYHPWLFMLLVAAFLGAVQHGDVWVAVVSLAGALWLVGLL